MCKGLTASAVTLHLQVLLAAGHARCAAVAVKQSLTLAEQEQEQGLAGGVAKAAAASWGSRVQERDKKQAGECMYCTSDIRLQVQDVEL